MAGKWDDSINSKNASAAKTESFKEAFARNRKEGAKTFNWNGKSYTTELAKPAAKQAPPSAVARKPASRVQQAPASAVARKPSGGNRPFGSWAYTKPSEVNTKVAEGVKNAGKAASASIANRGTKSFGEEVGESVKAAPRKYKAWSDANRDKSFGEAIVSKIRGYSKGGSVRGDGCAIKGKTKGRSC